MAGMYSMKGTQVASEQVAVSAMGEAGGNTRWEGQACV